MNKPIETPTPYEHVMIKFRVNMPGATRPFYYEKKGWYEPIGNIYCIPSKWENCSYGQRPATLEGRRLPEIDIVEWKKNNA